MNGVREQCATGGTGGIDYTGLESVLSPEAYARAMFEISLSEIACRASLESLADMGVGSRDAALLAGDLLYQHEVRLELPLEEAA